MSLINPQAEYNFVYWLFSCIHSRLDTLHDFFGDRPVDHLTYHILQMKEPSPSEPKAVKNKYDKLRQKSLPLIKSRFELFKKDVLKAMDTINIPQPNNINFNIFINNNFETEKLKQAPLKCLNKNTLKTILSLYLDYIKTNIIEKDSVLAD